MSNTGRLIDMSHEQKQARRKFKRTLVVRTRVRRACAFRVGDASRRVVSRRFATRDQDHRTERRLRNSPVDKSRIPMCGRTVPVTFELYLSPESSCTSDFFVVWFDLRQYSCVHFSQSRRVFLLVPSLYNCDLTPCLLFPESSFLRKKLKSRFLASSVGYVFVGSISNIISYVLIVGIRNNKHRDSERASISSD